MQRHAKQFVKIEGMLRSMQAKSSDTGRVQLLQHGQRRKPLISMHKLTAGQAAIRNQ